MPPIHRTLSLALVTAASLACDPGPDLADFRGEPEQTGPGPGPETDPGGTETDPDSESGTTNQSTYCGDGVVDWDEQCDQGLSPDNVLCNDDCAVPVYAVLPQEFDGSVNSNTSRWSYRYSNDTTLDGDYPLMSTWNFIAFSWDPILEPTLVWQTGNGGNPPYAGTNYETMVLSYSGIHLYPGELDVHPPSNGMVVASWLSDGDHVVTAQARFTAADSSCGNGIKWVIAKNSTTWNSGSYGRGSDSDFVGAYNIHVTAGDRIHFIVDANGSHACDSTTLQAWVMN
jgi:hypothetical protein